MQMGLGLSYCNQYGKNIVYYTCHHKSSVGCPTTFNVFNEYSRVPNKHVVLFINPSTPTQQRKTKQNYNRNKWL